MLSLRAVITQATRGGRWVVSRRNFSSSPVSQETKEVMEKQREKTKVGISLAFFSCVIISYGWRDGNDKSRAARIEKYLEEAAGKSTCRCAAERRDGKEKESVGDSSELPIADN